MTKAKITSIDLLSMDYINEASLQELKTILDGATNIHLINHTISPAGIKALTDILKSNDSVKFLTLDKCNLDDTAAEKIAMMLKFNGIIQYIDLSNNNITDAGAMSILAELAANKKDTKLNDIILFNNKLKNYEKFVQDLGKIIASKGGEVKEPIQTPISIDTLDTEPYKSALKTILNCHSFEQNYLDQMHWILEGVKKVKITNRIISEKGLLTLAHSLISNTAVNELDLSGCKISPEMCASLGALIKQNKHIEILRLQNCDINQWGALNLAQGLRNNSTLKEFYIDGNNIGDNGLQFIKQSQFSDRLKTGKLKTVSIVSDNAITDAGKLNYEDLCRKLESRQLREQKMPADSQERFASLADGQVAALEDCGATRIINDQNQNQEQVEEQRVSFAEGVTIGRKSTKNNTNRGPGL